MRDISDINKQTLPSGKRLLLSTLIALVVAAVVLVIAVLPAEYGLDPSGLGKRMGLTQLHQPNNTPTPLSNNTPTTQPAQSIVEPSAAILQKRPEKWRSDSINLTLLPKQGTEVKAHMEQGEKLLFQWKISGGTVSFDMHGNVINAAEDDFTSYLLGKGETQSAGTFTAPFTGLHGWYWENETDNPIKITLETEGYYLGLVTQ